MQPENISEATEDFKVEKRYGVKDKLKEVSLLSNSS